jgi:hypothetical protein
MDQPRVPAGFSEGGQFASKNSGFPAEDAPIKIEPHKIKVIILQD